MNAMKNVSDMMLALQEEIEAVKAGTLNESQARVIFKGRELQLKTAELNLKFQRLHKGIKPEQEMPMIGTGAHPANGHSTSET